MTTETHYLIVLRHGHCHEDRLLDRGRQAIDAAALALQHAGFLPDMIITSPTGRTRESTSLLRAHFNHAAALREYPLWFEESEHMEEITDLLSTVPPEYHTVLLSGHAETVNSFTYHLLGKEPDCSKLFKIAEPEKYNAYMSGEKERIYTSAAMGDALILEAEPQESAASLADMTWKLHGYVLDGELTLAQDVPVAPLPGKQVDVQRNFPILAFERG